MTLAAVPAKDLTNAKQRLIPILSASERRELGRAMLEDVLAALSSAGLDSVLVVTRDPDVMELARCFSATILEEPENRGHTEAVALAQRHAARVGAKRFLTVPGDVPRVTAAEIRAICRVAGTGPAAVLVPSRSGFGTNGVLLAPPDVMPLKFGEPSFENHLSAARERGLESRVLRLEGLGLDIDGPEDLAALVENDNKTRSARLLRSLGVPERLPPHLTMPLTSSPLHRGERRGEGESAG